MGYWERSKAVMSTVDWLFFALAVFAALLNAVELFFGEPLGLFGVVFFGFVALVIWWGNVSPYYPRGGGPDE